MKLIFGMLLTLVLALPIQATHLYSKSSYQNAYCSQIPNVQVNYVTNKKTYVDCLTDSHVIEFVFAPKYAKGLGKALINSFLTGKKSRIVLIVENPEKERKYIENLTGPAMLHGAEVEIITPKIFNLY